VRCSRSPIFLLCFGKWPIVSDNFLSKRKTRSSASSDESALSPEIKRTKPYSSSTHQEEEIMTALSMTQHVGATLRAILAKMEKRDSLESAVKKIEANLENLEKRTRRLEDFQTTAKKDDDLKREHFYWTTIQG